MTFRPANFDPSIDPTADQVRAFRDAGPDGPVVMLNLLKFRDQANYPAASPHAPCSGAEAYRRYQTAFVEAVGDVTKGLYLGAAACKPAGKRCRRGNWTIQGCQSRPDVAVTRRLLCARFATLRRHGAQAGTSKAACAA